ncbi:hypothetical protein [Sinobacterium caligoides]|uniref:hypothetical protein n=1 Tax=Sinobacterium caligoides TaxID=933926 RepID=UPI0013C35B7D|nr:hypothetical protein [Sinobacterium caligoides]
MEIHGILGQAVRGRRLLDWLTLYHYQREQMMICLTLGGQSQRGGYGSLHDSQQKI